MERAALTARGEELQVDLLAAEPLPSPPAPSRANAVMFGKALVIAATSIVGLGMISLGASLEPALSSIAELQALLPVPIVGVIPATHPGRRRTDIAPSPASCPLGLDDRRAGRAVCGRVAFLPRLRCS